MSVIGNWFEKPKKPHLTELQKAVTGERISVRAVATGKAMLAAEKTFPQVTLGDTMIERIQTAGTAESVAALVLTAPAQPAEPAPTASVVDLDERRQKVNAAYRPAA